MTEVVRGVYCFGDKIIAWDEDEEIGVYLRYGTEGCCGEVVGYEDKRNLVTPIEEGWFWEV